MYGYIWVQENSTVPVQFRWLDIPSQLWSQKRKQITNTFTVHQVPPWIKVSVRVHLIRTRFGFGYPIKMIVVLLPIDIKFYAKILDKWIYWTIEFWATHTCELRLNSCGPMLRRLKISVFMIWRGWRGPNSVNVLIKMVVIDDMFHLNVWRSILVYLGNGSKTGVEGQPQHKKKQNK